jgi:hypothetical protein
VQFGTGHWSAPGTGSFRIYPGDNVAHGLRKLWGAKEEKEEWKWRKVEDGGGGRCG